MIYFNIFYLFCNCRIDDLKFGDFKGVDKFGNRYYENNRYFFGK